MGYKRKPRLAARVSRLERAQEMKSFDAAVNAEVTSTATLTELSAVIQGDSNVEREGNSISIK